MRGENCGPKALTEAPLIAKRIPASVFTESQTSFVLLLKNSSSTSTFHRTAISAQFFVTQSPLGPKSRNNVCRHA